MNTLTLFFQQMKTYLILMMGALASALANETHVCKDAAADMKPMYNVTRQSNEAASYSPSVHNSLARKAGGHKYRLPGMLKKLRENRARDTKARTS